MKKDENTSTKIRNDITVLLKAIRPQFIRESALTQLLEGMVDSTGQNPYKTSNIRAVYNSYAGRSGSVHIPYVQGVKIGASNYYTYSSFENTKPVSLTIDEKMLENKSFLFIKKNINTFFFLDGPTEENKSIIEKFKITKYSFYNEEERDLDEYHSRYLMRIFAIQELLHKIFNSQKQPYIEFAEFLFKTDDFIYEKGLTHLFHDKYSDEDEFIDDPHLENENIKECLELVIALDNNYQLNDDKILFLNDTLFDQHEDGADFYLLEQNLKTMLLQIKTLQIEAIENNDIQLMINLKSLKKIEKALNKYFGF